jgi:hypothetical protein
MSTLRERVSKSPLRKPLLKGYKEVRKRVYKPLEGTPGAPDFIGVGAVTSGGPWWHSLICAHPQARPPRNRRPAQKFFDDFCYKELTDADIAKYHARFAKTPGTITGEWTEVYLTQSWTLPLLARIAPDAKILVSLVDPIDAYRKAYAQRKARVERGDKRVWMNTAASDRSYGNQLQALRKFFPAEQILVLQHEKCRADPRAEYRRTLQFLGLKDDFVPAQHLLNRIPPHERVYEAMQKVKIPDSAIDRTIGRPLAGHEPPDLWPDHEEALHVFLDPEIEELLDLVPDLDLSLWPDFAHLARSAGRAQVGR